MDLDRINELGFEKGSRWQSMVLVVSFSIWWNLFIVIQCYIVCLLCTFNLAYNTYTVNLTYLRYAIDLCYLLEVICTVSYHTNHKFKKLRYTKTRGWFFIVIDIISVIPFEIMYTFHYVSDNKDSYIYLILIQNRLLRIYRIFQLESYYGITVRKASQYAVLMFFQFTSKALLIAHILSCIWATVSKSIECDSHVLNCYIWHETNIAILVIHNWSGKMKMFNKSWERVVASAAIMFGFLLIFVFFYPYTLYISMQLNYKRALYYDKYGKLECFLRNMVDNTELREKVIGYFNDVWQKDRGDSDLDILIKNIPLALKKEIFTDIYWEAFRHSGLLREISKSCKRSLSLSMTTEYYHSGDVIYQKGQEKLKMMFLVQGIIQIMAEENENSPVLSFSSGTVFGELSLFLYSRSQSIVKCKSYCELQILTMKEVSSVMRDYPKDKKLIAHNLHQRLAMAKYTQWRKQKFRLEQMTEALDNSTTTTVEDCVKWIKTQWRAIWDGHQRHKSVLRAKEEGLRLPSWHRFVKPDIKIEFISNYLDLIVLSDVFEEKKDVVCLRTAFPWSIDPSAHFLKVWYYIILTAAAVPGLLYPYCTAWLNTFPRSVYVLSFVITGLFQIDVLLMLLTAVKTKHHIITQFSDVFSYRLQQPTFYLDVLAALPYQFYAVMNVDVDHARAYVIGLILHPAILKSHMFVTLRVPLSGAMDKVTVFKNCMICFLLIYWFAELIQLSGIKDLLQVERTNSWIDRFLTDMDNQNFVENNFLSVFRALVTALSVPDFYMYPDEDSTLVYFCAAKFFFFFFFCYFFADFYGVYTVKIFGEETFQVLLNRIKKFLESIYISPKIAKRLLKTIRFQWDYDNADYLSSKLPICKTIPEDLMEMIYSETTYKTLQSCRMFEDESLRFIADVMDRSSLVAVPFGSMLVTYGHTSHTVSIIHRGYCQLNSFLFKDINAELGTPVALTTGMMFPMLSSFCNMPAPTSIVSITDCELIMINLDDLLNLMIKHNFLKDIFEVAKTGKWFEKMKETKPAIMRLNLGKDVIKTEWLKQEYRRMGRFGSLFYYCCPRKLFNLKLVKNWEIIYTIYLMLVCIVWPCCFGLLLYVSHIIIPIIVVGKIIVAVHILFQFYTPYYNEKGILVSHPVYTFVNYISSTFLLDFLCVCPIYPVYLYLIADPYTKPSIYMVLINFAQHYLKLIHIIGFMDNLEHFVNSKYIIRMAKIILLLLLTLNLFVNLTMYLSADWIFGGPYVIIGYELPKKYRPDNPNLIRKNSITDFYLFVAHWILCSLMTTDYLLHETSNEQLYLSYVQSFIGTVLNFYLYSWLSSNSIFANIGGTIYQEKITSFVKYLKFEKADDKLIEYAISHYNHEWSQTQGENLKKIFEHLPIHLHEELVYPLYRPTFNKNKIFASADEGFFKILSMHVTSVYFNRGSIIIFQHESQSNIYFVHKGKCFVYDWFVVLDVGSMVGDLQRTGLMENKVYALTHVEMLKISSNDFFMLINSFDDLEATFLYKCKNAENFVKGEVQGLDYQLRPVDSRDVLNAFGLQNKDIGFEDESYFEDPENSSIQLLRTWKTRPEEKMRFLIIYPETWKMKAFVSIYVTITFLTLITIPTLMSFGTLTIEAFITIGILDFFWLIIILLSFRVGYIDKLKGDVITDFRYIAKYYAKRWDGLVVDILALIPFEFIPIMMARSFDKADAMSVAWLRTFRLLRGCYFIKNLRHESRKLKSNYFLKYLHVLMYLIVLFVVIVNVYIGIATEPSIVAARDPHELNSEQFFAFVLAFEYMINFIASSNLCVIIPDTMTQILYLNLNALVSPYAKGWLISQVLSILYVKGLATSYYKYQVIALESYLENKDTSPSIVKQVLNYKMNLLLFSRSENMPSFLNKAPASLKITIMRDLYLHHLLNCPLFQIAERIFLDQLVARMKREIYFPGQMIVEQFDVDHRVYFIHKGEVYVMNHTKEKQAVEYVEGKLLAGEFFGEAQGLWLSLPHTHTYRARTLVEVVVLHSDDWVDLRRAFPDTTKEIFDRAKALRII